MSLGNLTVKMRLSLLLGMLCVLLTGIGGLGLYGASASSDALQTVNEDRVVPLAGLGEMIDILARIRINAMSAFTSNSVEVAKELSDKNRSLDGQIQDLWAKFMATRMPPEEKQMANTFRQQLAIYFESRDRTMKLSMEGDFAGAKENAVRDAGPKFSAARETLFKIINLQGDIAKREYDASQGRYVTLRNVSVASILAGLGLSLLFGGLLIRSLMRQLGGEPDYAAEVVRRVAAGDLSVQVRTQPGDTTSLLASLKGMVGGLTQLVGEVRNTTDTITTASQEIAQGNADLSQRTEEQASSLEETASSMEELTSTVRLNTENAKHANQLANEASDIAVKGGKAIGDVVHTMASITESSKRIVDIISVIDGIAFQTNILALNAAVEAARAGEQGRGFAVVAGEVRNLAQRSATAAKEIKFLIDDSVGKVEAGSKQVDEAGATMGEVVHAVKRMTDLMSEIAAASNEQSAGIEQVNQAITQMDEVTQQNAALVEEAAAAAEAMQEQAQALMHAVSAFKLEAVTAISRNASARTAIENVVKPANAQNAENAIARRAQARLAKAMDGSGGTRSEVHSHPASLPFMPSNFINMRVGAGRRDKVSLAGMV